MTDTVTPTTTLHPDAPRDWHFTFGAGQRFDGHYLTIHGTYDAARAEMIRRFGLAWCAMYDATRPVEVTKFPTGLTELPRAQWPDPARPTVLDFGAFGIPAAHIDTPATAEDIRERISDELDSAGYDLDVLTLRFDDGGMSVTVLDSDDCPLGTVTISQPSPDPRHRLRAELHRIADDIVRLELPVGTCISLHLGVVASRDELAPWADYLSTAVNGQDRNGIPFVETKIELGDNAYGPGLTVAAQSPKEESEAESEAERLRVRVAELEAKLAEGGEPR